jgi:hypothetical protein
MTATAVPTFNEKNMVVINVVAIHATSFHARTCHINFKSCDNSRNKASAAISSVAVGK